MDLKKIPSFTVDHNILEPGIYVSRKDRVGEEIITTFDLRVTAPNREPVINTAEIHSIEHIGATFLRNDPEWKDKTIYFGPMGCRTGFYAIFAGDLSSKDIAPLIIRMFEFIRDFKETVPGTLPSDCGNCRDHNLIMANWEAKRYLDRTLYVLDEAHMKYGL